MSVLHKTKSQRSVNIMHISVELIMCARVYDCVFVCVHACEYSGQQQLQKQPQRESKGHVGSPRLHHIPPPPPRRLV